MPAHPRLRAQAARAGLSLEEAEDRGWLQALDRPVPVLTAAEVPPSIRSSTRWQRHGADATRLRRLNPVFADGCPHAPAGRCGAAAGRTGCQPAAAHPPTCPRAPGPQPGGRRFPMRWPTRRPPADRATQPSSSAAIARSIACRYGVRLDELLERNGLDDARGPASGNGPRDRCGRPRRDRDGHGRIAPGPYHESSMVSQGKRALITGIASQRSIANGIAEAMHREVRSWRSPTRTTSSRVASRRWRRSSVAVRRIRSTSPTTPRSRRCSSSSASTGATLDTGARDRLRPARGIAEFDGLPARASPWPTTFRRSLSAPGCARPLMQGRKGAILTLSYLAVRSPLAT